MKKTCRKYSIDIYRYLKGRNLRNWYKLSEILFSESVEFVSKFIFLYCLKFKLLALTKNIKINIFSYFLKIINESFGFTDAKINIYTISFITKI